MTVIDLRRNACRRCGSTLNLPHVRPVECFEANAQELQQLISRSRELIKKRSAMTEEQIKTSEHLGAKRKRKRST